MSNTQKMNNLLKLCEDLQANVHLRDVTTDENSLRFSCDLLLRNMIMILELNKNGREIGNEYGYILNNILGASSHLTGEDAKSVAKRYNISWF